MKADRLTTPGAAGQKPAFEFTNLMSPPGNFSLNGARSQMPSPPPSPQTEARKGAVFSLPQQPVFPASEAVQHRRLVNEHIAHRDAAQFRSSESPRPEEYELALQVKSQLLKMYTRDRLSWMQKERELLVNDRKMNHNRWNNKRYTPIAPAPAPARTVVKSSSPSPYRPVSRSAETPTAKPDRVSRQLRARLPGTAVSPCISKARPNTVTPEPGRRKDHDFNALEDLCPPLDSLPNKPNSLKVDWKGSPVNLSQDPHAHLLHPDELSLAANLRLDCATYLTSKRRIFIRRRACAVQAKEFRKTDAQRACKIDVNKASKLWTAFEKVGWLDMHWIRKFM